MATTKRKWGAKTTIGDAAAQSVFDKNWANTKMPVDEMKDKITKARNEADDEVKRETRGMKKGGAVKGKWIQSAIKKPGALKKSLGVKAGEKIPAKKLATAAKAPGKLGQRARLAQTLKKMK